MKKRVFGFIAICLILSMILPINTQAQAAVIKFEKKSKTLYLNEDNLTKTPNEYKLAVMGLGSAKKKCRYKWSISNTGVVDFKSTKTNYSRTLVAKKCGSATVKCIVTKENKKTVTLTCIIHVKANAKKVDIKNAPDDNCLAVGDTFNYNINMKAKNGGTATDKQEWFISDETIATINKIGVVTALKPGMVDIVCKAYQSKSTKESSGYTAESKPVTLKIINKISSVTQNTKNQVSVTMMADAGDMKPENVSIQKIDSATAPVSASSITGVDNNTYNITFPDLDRDSDYEIKIRDTIVDAVYTATLRTSDYQPVSLQLDSTSGKAAVEHTIKARLFDAAGIEQTDAEYLKNVTVEPIQGSAYIIRYDTDEPGSFRICGAEGNTSVNLTFYYNKGKTEEFTTNIRYSFSTPDPTPEPLTPREIYTLTAELKTSADELGLHDWISSDESGMNYIKITQDSSNDDFVSALVNYSNNASNTDVREEAEDCFEDMLNDCFNFKLYRNGVLVPLTADFGYITRVILPNNYSDSGFNIVSYNASGDATIPISRLYVEYMYNDRILYRGYIALQNITYRSITD